jgi:triacylglycerol lipase
VKVTCAGRAINLLYRGSAMVLPILLVHGIWDDGARFDRMRGALDRVGLGPIKAIDLTPNDGSGAIEELAGQVDRAATELAGERPIDIVGFSMGALVSRYWVQKLRGKHRARRFVSISGPHGGTVTAFVMGKPGVKPMRPKSALLAELDADPDPWGGCEVHTVWTPYDLMIVPPRSSRLPNAAYDHCLPVPLHRWMITHPKAIDTVVSILT